MTAFELPISDGKPLEIVDFKIDLLSSPPEIMEKVIEGVDDYVLIHSDAIQIVYNDEEIDEGRLNIYICKFKTGKCRFHVFGKIKGQEFKIEKGLSDFYSDNLSILNERVKYILVRSRNILKLYYLNSNLQSIEDHLNAFLIAS
ncbi:MAG TPA: hypothetical protein VN026_05190 [Bacteroidia bacterium]|jgi:hypothetical protein|nr:hypothetical protein [Bacteroidia bacterium]